MAHCSRCLIPWGEYNGLYLIEVDRNFAARRVLDLVRPTD
ncbi:unnamed protein product [Rhodiola kirilowii]